jgi:hypothetical protein
MQDQMTKSVRNKPRTKEFELLPLVQIPGKKIEEESTQLNPKTIRFSLQNDWFNQSFSHFK